VSAARKSVIVRKLSRDWCAGYATGSLTAGSLADDREMELLDATGKLVKIPWGTVKWVCYVREIFAGEGSGSDTINPERLLRRRFTSKPRITGLWVRLLLVDGDELEGVTANDRSLIEGRGLLLTPPDTRSNTQRVFVPRSSIRELSVLGVMAAPASAPRAAQPGLFEANLFADSVDESPANGSEQEN